MKHVYEFLGRMTLTLLASVAFYMTFIYLSKTFARDFTQLITLIQAVAPVTKVFSMLLAGIMLYQFTKPRILGFMESRTGQEIENDFNIIEQSVYMNQAAEIMTPKKSEPIKLADRCKDLANEKKKVKKKSNVKLKKFNKKSRHMEDV